MTVASVRGIVCTYTASTTSTCYKHINIFTDNNCSELFIVAVDALDVVLLELGGQRNRRITRVVVLQDDLEDVSMVVHTWPHVVSRPLWTERENLVTEVVTEVRHYVARDIWRVDDNLPILVGTDDALELVVVVKQVIRVRLSGRAYSEENCNERTL